MTQQQLIKHTGATCTPLELGQFLADKLMQQVPADWKQRQLTVLDPACGEGALLEAMTESLQSQCLPHRLLGYDSSPSYVAEAQARLPGFAEIAQADFLELVAHQDGQMRLGFDTSKGHSSLESAIDVIIANPPYVRTQVLGAEKAQRLAKKYGLKGRVDLYYPFLMAMTDSLKPGGLLA